MCSSRPWCSARCAAGRWRTGSRSATCAPGWGDIIDWVRDHSRHRPGDVDPGVLEHYTFIGDVLPEGPVLIVRRASATIARLSDA